MFDISLVMEILRLEILTIIIFSSTANTQPDISFCESFDSFNSPFICPSKATVSGKLVSAQLPASNLAPARIIIAIITSLLRHNLNVFHITFTK